MELLWCSGGVLTYVVHVKLGPEVVVRDQESTGSTSHNERQKFVNCILFLLISLV
jgi:hypothetical protein